MPYGKETARICQHCGCEMTRTVFSSGRIETEKRFSKRMFCGRTCAGLAKRKHDNLYVQSQKNRKLARVHRSKTCDKCGSFHDLVMHHVDGDATNNEIDNLQTLCRGCHASLHHLGTTRGRKYGGASCAIDGCEDEARVNYKCKHHYILEWKRENRKSKKEYADAV